MKFFEQRGRKKFSKVANEEGSPEFMLEGEQVPTVIIRKASLRSTKFGLKREILNLWNR